MRYFGIFLVCLASIAFEIFLVRHFAITSWSEYGYWVISMAMAGYSMSGVLLCLFCLSKGMNDPFMYFRF